MATPKIPVITTPKLFDRIFALFNSNLATQLTWLDYTFGQAEKLTRKKGKEVIVYPAVYAGQNIENEYRSVLPSEFFGAEEAITGFSFIQVDDPDYDIANVKSSGYVSANISIIFWFNLKKVLNSDTEYRNIDKVILQCIQAVKYSSRGFKGHIKPKGWTKDPDRIYQGYSLRHDDQKYLMHPFTGVRIYCDMRFFEDC